MTIKSFCDEGKDILHSIDSREFLEQVEIEQGKCRAVAQQHGLKRLAFEAIHLPFQIFTDLRSALDPAIELVPRSDLVDENKTRKGRKRISQPIIGQKN